MKNAAIGTAMCALHNGVCLVQSSAIELIWIEFYCTISKSKKGYKTTGYRTCPKKNIIIKFEYTRDISRILV